jgi:hypothetical protein
MRVETLRPVRLALVAVAHATGAEVGPIADGIEALVGVATRMSGSITVGLTAGALAGLARHGGGAVATLERAMAAGVAAPILLPAHGGDARMLDDETHTDELRLDAEALASVIGEGAVATARRGTLVGRSALDEARAERLASWGLDYAVVPSPERGPVRRGERLVVFGAAPFPVGEPARLRAIVDAAKDGEVVPLVVWLDEGEAAAETLVDAGLTDEPRVALWSLDAVRNDDGRAPAWLPAASSASDEAARATWPVVEAAAWLADACGMPRTVPVDGEALVALDDPAGALPPRAAVPLFLRRARASVADDPLRAYDAVARACRLLAAECLLTDARPRAATALRIELLDELATSFARAVGDPIEIARTETLGLSGDDDGALSTAEGARRKAEEALAAFCRADEALRSGFLAGRSRFGEAARRLGEHAAWAARALAATSEAGQRRSIESWRMRPVASA